MPQNIPKIGDSNFDALRSDKAKIPLPAERDLQIARFYIALKMMKDFTYRLWMSDSGVVGPNDERINLQGEVFTPKFRRKI